MIIKLKNGNTLKVWIEVQEKNNQNYSMGQLMIEGIDAKYILHRSAPRAIELILLSMGYDESDLEEMGPDSGIENC